MIDSLNWFTYNYSKFVRIVDKHSEKIPFSKSILIYLRLPIGIRLIMTLTILGISHGISYIIGFIILQSKAKNEVLSLITAFQNPIAFSDRLYYYYAFVYLFVTILTVVLFGAYLFFGEFLLFKKLKKKKSIFYLGILIWIVFAIPWFFLLLQLASFIPYYLFYSSKNPSTWEASINYFIYAIPFNWFSDSIDYNDFQKEILISLQSGNMAVVLFIFMFSKSKKFFNDKKNNIKRVLKLIHYDLDIAIYRRSSSLIIFHSFIFFFQRCKAFIIELTSTIILLCFIASGSILLVSHTANQIGSFGKNLSKFDSDYVEVTYTMNDEKLIIQGIRVYQDKNYIVLREKNNKITSIFTDQIFIQTILPQQIISQ